eukprot:gene29336-35414_t
MESRLLTLSQNKLQSVALHAPSLGPRIFMPHLSVNLLNLPCIIYLDNLDSLIDAQAPAGVLVATESPEDTFFSTLEKFINELCCLYEDNDRTSGFSQQSAPVIVASTGKLQSFRPKTLSLFPLVIPCPPAPSLDRILEYFSSPTDPCSMIPTHDAKADLLRWLRKNNVYSPSLVAEVWRGLMKEVIARESGEHWLNEVGLGADQPLPSSNCSSSLSLLPQDLVEWVSKGGSTLMGMAGEGKAAKGVGGADVAPVTWSQVGGLEAVKKELRDLLDLPLAHPHLFPPQAPRRRGVLLYGPPGTGKTLVAKALATESGRAFLSVKGPELLDSYVGESEGNVRKIFAQASSLAPSLLFLDEIDALAPRRSSNGAGGGGGVMDRMVAQILGEMDRAHEGVVVVGATNRPDLLDPALLRGGRLDRAVYMGGLKGVDEKKAVLEAQLRGVSVSRDVNLCEVAQSLPEGVTGAQIGGVTSRAVMRAVHKKVEQLKRQATEFYNISVENVKDNGHRDTSANEVDDDDRILKHYLATLADDGLVVSVEMVDFIEEAKHVVPPAYSEGTYDWMRKEGETC